jgi:hypothetical protein
VVVDPLPSCPALFPPHDQTASVVSSARLWTTPPATCVTGANAVNSVGTVRGVVVPSPICELAFSPQA